MIQPNKTNPLTSNVQNPSPSLNKNNSNQQDLHTLFRSQIIQKYPPSPSPHTHNHNNSHYSNPVFLQQQLLYNNNIENNRNSRGSMGSISSNKNNNNNFYQQQQNQSIDFINQIWGNANNSNHINMTMNIKEKQHEIVQEYIDIQHKNKRRSIMNFQNLMASQSDNNDMPLRNSRNSSLSSKENNNNVDFNINRSYDKLPLPAILNLKKFSDQFMMDVQQENHGLEKRRSYIQGMNQNVIPSMNLKLPTSTTSPHHPSTDNRDRQRTQKINKIQQIGCNCRKSKCLKMYCQCFHLQIFCSQNCNCVDCGNTQPNQYHQKAVIQALTRNPKAFQQENPTVEKGFQLGVELAEVKKGCKCKKTKCLKKYCQCYSTGARCGIFCKCENCENN